MNLGICADSSQPLLLSDDFRVFRKKSCNISSRETIYIPTFTHVNSVKSYRKEYSLSTFP